MYHYVVHGAAKTLEALWMVPAASQLAATQFMDVYIYILPIYVPTLYINM